MKDPAPDPAPVLRLGDPRLREVARPVEDPADPTFIEGARRLQATLEDFRRRHGFGRAISAPQIGLPWRLIALNLDGRPFLVLNPDITCRSRETFTLWDDCMSFPSLLVRVRRNASISVRYRDAAGRSRHMRRLDRARSELLQHEIDHLDGILAVDRALDRDALVCREEFERTPERFRAMVD